MLHFMYDVFVYNVLKLSTYDKEYFKQHFPLSDGTFKMKDIKKYTKYSRIVKYSILQFGYIGAISANIALSIVGMILLFDIDLIFLKTQSYWLKLFLSLFSFVFCIYKFDILFFKDRRNYVKLLFLTYNLLLFPYWSLVYLLLIVFENITIV